MTGLSFSIFTSTCNMPLEASGTPPVTPPVVAPVAAGALPDQTFTEATGDASLATAGDFTGTNLIFSLHSAPSGVSIDPVTGLVTFATAALALQTDTPVVVRASNAGGAADSGFALTVEAAVVPAPGVTGSLDDVTLIEGDGVQTMPTAQVFSGAELVFALVSGVAGVTIDAATGVLTLDPAALALQTDTPVVVRASNAGGAADSGFALTVEAAVTAPAPTFAAATLGEDDPVNSASLRFAGRPTETVFGYDWQLQAANSFDTRTGLSGAMTAAEKTFMRGTAPKIVVVDFIDAGQNNFGITVHQDPSGGGPSGTIFYNPGNNATNPSGILAAAAHGVVDVSDLYGEAAGSGAVRRMWFVLANAQPFPDILINFSRQSIPGQRQRHPSVFAAALFEDDLAGMEAQIAALVPFGAVTAAPTAAPVVTGSLPPQTFTQGTGMQTVDTSVMFEGHPRVFSLPNDPDEMEVDPDTGILTVDTDGQAVQSGAVAVRASNAGGAADTTLDVIIEAALPDAPTPTGSLADQTFTQGTDVQTIPTAQVFSGEELVFSLSAAPNGLAIDAATGIISADTDTLDVQSETAVVVVAGNPGGSASRGFQMTVEAAAAPASDVTFGAATRVGQGGVPVAEADGTYGAFTVAGGVMTPNAALSAGTYTVGGTSVAVVADTITVASETELRDVLMQTSYAPQPGDTVAIRDKGSIYGLKSIPWATIWSNHPSGVTFAPADPGAPPEIDYWELIRVPISDVTFRGLRFSKTDYPARGSVFSVISSSLQSIIQAANGQVTGLTFEECVFDGGLPPWTEGGRFTAQNPVIQLMGAGCGNFTFRRNIVRNISDIMVIGVDGFVIEDNLFERYHNDGLVLQNASNSDCSNGIIRNNHYRDQVGWPVLFHTDLVQFQGRNEFATDIRDLQIYGNTACMGDTPTPSQVDPINRPGVLQYGPTEPTGTNPGITYITATSRVLDITDHAREVRLNGGMAVTLPPAAASAGLQFCLRGISATPGQISLHPGDTWEGGALPALGNQATATFVSDGTSQWKLIEGHYKPEFVQRTYSKTLGASETNRLAVINASAGDVTLSLPQNGALELALTREDGSSNTATLVPAPGDTLIHHGASVAAITFTQGYGINVVGNGAGTWTTTERGASSQGIFGNAQANPNGTFENIDIHGNVIFVSAPHGIKLEQDVTGLRSWNNTILRPDFTDSNGDGVENRYEVANEGPMGSININGEGAFSFRDITVGGLFLTNNAIDGHAIDTIAAAATSKAAAYAALTPYLVNTAGAALRPSTRAQVIEAARTQSGVKQGAYAYYDFDAGAPRAGLDTPGVTEVTPTAGGTLSESTPLRITYDHFVQMGTGALTIWNDTDDVALETFDMLTGLGSAGGTVALDDMNALTITGGAGWPIGKEVSLRAAAGVLRSTAYDTATPAIPAGAYTWTVLANASVAPALVSAFETSGNGVAQTASVMVPAGRSILLMGQHTGVMTQGDPVVSIAGTALPQVGRVNRGQVFLYAFEINSASATATQIDLAFENFQTQVALALYDADGGAVISSDGYAAGGGDPLRHDHTLNLQQGQGVIAMAMVNRPAGEADWSATSGWDAIDANNDFTSARSVAVTSAANVTGGAGRLFRAEFTGTNQDKASLAIVLG